MTAARLLVLGGTGYLGAPAARALRAAGHDVTSLSRSGRSPADGMRAIAADRSDPDALARALEGERFDVTVDFAAYDSADVERLLLIPHAALGLYILISSGQVYLVTENPPIPSREEDSERPLLAEPAVGTPDHGQWAYGIGKRRAERAALVLRDSHGVRAVVLRLPVIHGEGDPRRRLWRYLERLKDGGPVILPDDGAQATRYLWVEDVARAVVRVLGIERPREAVYNLAGPEIVPLREFLERAARALGAPAPRFVSAGREEIAAAGLDAMAWPLSGRWSSVLDPARAEAEWGFTGTPLDDWLPRVVRALCDHPPDPIEGEDARRVRELAFAARRVGEPGLTPEKARD